MPAVFQSSPLLIVIVLLLGYAVKSLVVLFPLALLEIAAGGILPLYLALPVNAVGLLITLTIPYWVGRKFDKVSLKLLEKYPRLQKFSQQGAENALFLCFFLRIIRIVPTDAVSLMAGVKGYRFRHNMLGGFLGLMPAMVLTTLFGSSMDTPSSPVFWVSLLLSVLLAVAAVLINHRYKLHNDKDPT